MEFSENQLVSMISENNDDVKDAIYEKYKYIIDIVISKYKRSIYGLGIDINEVKQDAMLAFTDALIRYNEEKASSLPTFISICVERKIQNCIRKATSQKQMQEKLNYSLDQEELGDRPLSDFIGDLKNDPLNQMEKQEEYKMLVQSINESLSPLEKDVYNLVINGFNYRDIAKILNKDPKQIDNTIQRIRKKVKEINLK